MTKGNGAGKYDAACTMARLQTNADAVVLIVLAGTQGDGFSVQGHERHIRALPALLESMAAQIRAQLEAEL